MHPCHYTTSLTVQTFTYRQHYSFSRHTNPIAQDGHYHGVLGHTKSFF